MFWGDSAQSQFYESLSPAPSFKSKSSSSQTQLYDTEDTNSPLEIQLIMNDM